MGEIQKVIARLKHYTLDRMEDNEMDYDDIFAVEKAVEFLEEYDHLKEGLRCVGMIMLEG